MRRLRLGLQVRDLGLPRRGEVKSLQNVGLEYLKGYKSGSYSRFAVDPGESTQFYTLVDS